jgi:mannose-6-phosphate isomerase-like protein (cupin superfamily)
MTSKNEKKSYRRVVTGHENGNSIVQTDERLEAYRFKAVPGFEHTLLWENYGIPDLSREQKPGRYPQSLIPEPGGSTLHIVTYPPDRVSQLALDPAAAVKEFAERLPGLSDSFEREDPGMHRTNTVDYAVVLEGEIWLEMDRGKTIHLKRGDTVIQNGTRHAWRNKGQENATMLYVILGAKISSGNLTVGMGNPGRRLEPQ